MATYYPQVFDAADEAAARAIILTDEGEGADTETRWARETPYLVELVRAHLRLGPESLVLDYGCGIGRMARALIAATGCRVVGVDISARMRALAAAHVADERFMAVAPAQLDGLVAHGLRADAALAVWVLQHCLAPAEDIARLRAALAPQGRLFVLNMPGRAVPAVQEAGGEARFVWAADGIDVAALLRARFAVEAAGEPDMARVPRMSSIGAYWMVLRG
jgi:SAM-dependent methyltransferase